MGLDACCGGVCERIGSYGWFHTFRLAVNELEGGNEHWGEKYPKLMNHSDCDGHYTPKQAEKLRAEIAELREKLGEVQIACWQAFDAAGEVLHTRHQYDSDGVFSSGGPDRHAYGVNRQGIFRTGLIKDPKHPNADWMTMPDMENAEFFTVLKPGDPMFENLLGDVGLGDPKLAASAKARVVEIRHGFEPASKVFERMLDTFTKLCDESIETGQRIEFC